MYSSDFDKYADKYDSLVIKLGELGIKSVLLSTNTGILDERAPTYLSRVKDFILHAHQAGITVHAMHMQSYTYLDDYNSAVTATNKVIAFNNSVDQTERFDGIHLDVEPHTHPDWNSQTGFLPGSQVNENIMKRFVGLLDTLKSVVDSAMKNGSDSLFISADQTYWIHDKIAAGQLQTGTVNDLLQFADFITLFDYTDNYEKLVSYIESEVTQSSHPNSIVAALKTTDDKNYPQESFYDEGWFAFDKSEKELSKHYENSPAFLGTCIFEYGSVRKMFENRFPVGLITSVEDDICLNEIFDKTSPGKWTRSENGIIDNGITEDLTKVHYGEKAIFVKVDWTTGIQNASLRYELKSDNKDWSTKKTLYFWGMSDVQSQGKLKFCFIDEDGDYWQSKTSFDLSTDYTKNAVVLDENSFENIGNKGNGVFNLESVKFLEFLIEGSASDGIQTYYFDDVILSEENTIYTDYQITTIENDIYENGGPSSSSPGEWTRYGAILSAAGITTDAANVYSGSKAVYYTANWNNGTFGGLRYQLGALGQGEIQDWSSTPIISFWAKTNKNNDAPIKLEILEEDGDRWRVKDAINLTNQYEEYTFTLEANNVTGIETAGNGIFELGSVKFVGISFEKGSSSDKFSYYFDDFERHNSTGVEEDHENALQNFRLFQNYPNPFNPNTVIGYTLPRTGHVTLKVYDILGREIGLLVNRLQQAGYHHVEFNTERFGGALPSGIYFYVLSSGQLQETKKFVLLK